ncbi:ABC transporter ATP-binding protein [Pediococcus pentosaceus]|uniref:ABC transporter ATP-binding protein n=1 Tax=Pediococcus pentosaceus TaxID=1255 RepID=UPI0021A4B137|nr:ABC transporter ATP-binding protein [Pediococcus pentosaceus]MCT3033273.1 ABC transporter ATP-binding protein [Pediococcus pentosaceus]
MKELKLFKITTLFSIGLLLSVVGNFINLLIPLQIRRTIDLKKILDDPRSYQLILKLVCLLILGALIDAISEFLISREGDKQIANIRISIQKHLLGLPLSFFDENISGQLASRVINDASVVKNFMSQVIPSFINNLITLVGTIGILFYLDWKITCVVLISFPLFSLVAIPIGKITKTLSVDYQAQLGELNGTATESFQNIRSVKLNVAEKSILRKFSFNVNGLYKLSIKADVLNAVISPFQVLLSYGVVFAILVYGGIRVSIGTITVGTLVSVLIYFFQLMPALQAMSSFYSSYKQAIGSMQQVKKIISIPTENINNDSCDLVISNNNSLRLQNVSFSYEDKKVLQEINMVFPQKAKIAIVGPSGAGKTTIINILTRLYPISSGQIVLGTTNADEYSLTSWREMFSVVTQENSIISGSIKDNLIFGLPNPIEDDKLETALKAANLWNDIRKLPEGMETIVGENGVKLSGGQRQRLQIARTYLKDAQFVIFDEATSNLDADSEKLVTESMNKLTKEKTVIAIAHRLSTIIDSDLIFFLEDNKIQASGTHKKLIKSLPSYAKFVSEQMLSN